MNQAKYTKKTNIEGFYLKDDESVSIYNEASYLWTDMHDLNMEMKTKLNNPEEGTK
jgi:hypothetical protein